MKKSSPFAIILVLLVAATAVWFLVPSVIFYSKKPDKRLEIVKNDPDLMKKVINLGLDLQGGMRLVLEVDKTNLTDEQKMSVLDVAYTVIENRINGLGVAEPSIQKQGDNRLIVELPGLKDGASAKKVIGSTAQLEFKLVRNREDIEKAINAIDAILKGKAIEKEDTSAVKDSSEVASKKVQKETESLFAGSDAEKAEKDSIDTSNLKEEDTEESITSISSFLVQVGGRDANSSRIYIEEKNVNKVSEILSLDKVTTALRRAGLGSSEFLFGHDIETLGDGIKEYRMLYFVKKKAEMKGDIISGAQWQLASSGMQAGQAIVNLKMNRKGSRQFARTTGNNVNRALAIVLDNTVYSAPTINQKISQGRAQITGSFTNDEAKGLAIVLQAGALPAPVEAIEERTVGPSLGQDSINKAVKAFIFGFVIIVLFMIVYYGVSGLIANIALLFNLIFILAIMASIGSTLTLPGIAGLILIMGMAIDANVIIFERIREELALGKTVRNAIEAGYNRAHVTILDANITTLFTALILMWVGTGPIKGFAVTMIIGIIVSLFTSLYITKIIFNIMTSSNKSKKLSI